MNRVDAMFARLRQEDGRALMPFIVAGRPSLDRLPDLLASIERAGASAVEIGIPFSDPIADGPVIAAALDLALRDGVTPTGVFDAVRRARDSVAIPLIAMVSVTIIHRMGIERFMREAAAAGLDGLILPDAPLEEAEAFTRPARAAGLGATLLVAPDAPPERAAAIARTSSGFVYLLARAGLTGERGGLPEVARRVRALRDAAGIPVVCGFGISTAEQVRAAVAGPDGADGAIVGSALVRRIEEAGGGGGDAVAAAHSFVLSLFSGVRQG